jgi:hypothetical protein
MKEPYRNMFIGHLKNSLAKKYFSLSELKKLNTNESEKNKQIQELLKLIEKELDVGESLIMMDRVMPTSDIQLNLTQAIFQAGLNLNTQAASITRVHIYKKSATIIQIFDDTGDVKTIDLSFQMRNYIPILKLSAKLDSGKYSVKSYNVNISSDQKENPNFFQNALGIYEILNKHNFEILNNVSTPVKLQTHYSDRTYRLSLFWWKLKSLSGKTYYDVEAKDGIHGSYFSYTKDFMSGINLEAFTKQLANYYLEKKVKNFSISNIDDRNPGATLFGKSSTHSLKFEAEIDENKVFERKFISLSEIKEGWSSSKTGLLNFIDTANTKFQTEVFNKLQIDFDKIRLYKVGYHVNIYERGIDRLKNISLKEIENFEINYKKVEACTEEYPGYGSAFCGDLHMVKSKMSECRRTNSDEESGVCLTGLFEQMFNDIKFQDLKKLLGENNLYVYATIDGFREKSEILNDTIYSNSIGKIGSDEWQGPLQSVRDLIGIPEGEFTGGWLREGGR